MNILQNLPATLEQLSRALGKKKTEVNPLLQNLVREGKVKQEPQENNSFIYTPIKQQNKEIKK